MYIFLRGAKTKSRSLWFANKNTPDTVTMVEADLSEFFDFHDFSASRTSLTDYVIADEVNLPLIFFTVLLVVVIIATLELNQMQSGGLWSPF
jgi:hypothetical protein